MGSPTVLRSGSTDLETIYYTCFGGQFPSIGGNIPLVLCELPFGNGSVLKDGLEVAFGEADFLVADGEDSGKEAYYASLAGSAHENALHQSR